MFSNQLRWRGRRGRGGAGRCVRAVGQGRSRQVGARLAQGWQGRDKIDPCNFKRRPMLSTTRFEVHKMFYPLYPQKNIQGSTNRRAPGFCEFCSCSCLPLLPQLSCSIHATWGPPISGALYIYVTRQHVLFVYKKNNMQKFIPSFCWIAPSGNLASEHLTVGRIKWLFPLFSLYALSSLFFPLFIQGQ